MSGGDTIISSALILALKQFQGDPARVKHVILLTDGQTKDVKTYDYRSLVAAYAREGVSLSAIGIGSDTDEDFLKALAYGTDGEYYRVDDINTLPMIVLMDKDKVLAKRGFLEEAFTPSIGDRTGMLKGIERSQLPRLLGHVITVPKERAEVPLYTDIRGVKDPVLASWRYGLGKAAAFMADAEARWSREMVSWKMFAKFWAQVVRWLMRDRMNEALAVQCRAVDGKSYVTLNAVSESDETGRYRLIFRGPGGKDETVALYRTAPHEFRAEIDYLPPSLNSVEIEKVAGDKRLFKKEAALIRREGASPPSGETASVGNDTGLLKDIAEATGGTLDPDVSGLEFQPVTVVVRKDLTGWLIPLVFVFLLGDIAARKFGA
jgi:uncharacterized membrane protein